jgi:hypothetical protein
MKHKLLLALLSIALVSQSVWAAKGGKPPPIPQPNHVVWVDANGVMIGDAQTDVRPEIANVYFEVNESLYLAQMNNEKLTGGTPEVQVFYDQFECTGNTYLNQREIIGGVDILHGFRDGIFYTANGDEQTIILGSYWFEDEARCVHFNTGPTANNVFPAVPLIDTNNYAKPYKLKLIPAN